MLNLSIGNIFLVLGSRIERANRTSGVEFGNLIWIRQKAICDGIHNPNSEYENYAPSKEE